MYIPEKITVLGKEITIEIKPFTENDRKAGHDLDGFFDPCLNKICINGNLGRNDIKETLFHELFHAVFYHNGLRQTNISSDLEEIIVNQFSIFVCDNFEIAIKRTKK